MFDYQHQLAPFLPGSPNEDLYRKASVLIQSSLKLSAVGHTSSRKLIRELVRSINAHHSNRIGEEGTSPFNIAQALKRGFSDKPEVARRQRMALAHIEAAKELDGKLLDGQSALASQFLIDAHRAFYSRLSDKDRTNEDGLLVEPGALRNELVAVGQCNTPKPELLPHFLERIDEIYSRKTDSERQLITIASLHHRAAWLCPFTDGSGRATLLQTDSALSSLSGGLWSPAPGLPLATVRQDYWVTLNSADGRWSGDVNGRIHLTAVGLAEWISFFLDVCLDQVARMGRMLDLDEMKKRIAALIQFRAATDKTMRAEAILPLHHLFTAGPINSSEFIQLTGLREHAGRALLSRLLEAELITSDSARVQFSFALPMDALTFLLPELFPEAHAENPDD